MTSNIVKNDPSRFLGEGMPFRAKLIGVLQVPEARGDRMCQDALSDLKIAIRAAGEHKQRITVHVAIDGLRLREDKTGDTLYHHPVHKISFIAQDMQDSRAFGYIFGSPDQGHRFFGIKTDKAASNVVMAMRDLFQVVFELKKREIELAKQQLEAKSVISIQRQIATITSDVKIKGPLSLGESSTNSTPTAAARETHADGGVAELVDLEQELSSLRRGLTQVEGLTPPGDPFGDSFIAPPVTSAQKGLLPPPPSGSSTRGRSTPSTSSQQSRTVFSPNKTTTAALPFDLPSAPAVDFEPVVTASAVEDLEPISVISRENAATSLSYDVFTELDPLGTGKNKPYVDKKLFFQELKNPPKKVLKDLVPTTNTATLPEVLPSTGIEAKIEQFTVPTTMTSMSRHSGGSVTVVKQPQNNYSSNFFATDPFAETDPFDSADPFSGSFKDDPFTNLQDFPKTSLKSEPIHTFKNSIKHDLPSYQEFTKNASEAILNYTKSFNHSIKNEVGSFPDFPKSSAIRYDDLSSCSKIRESSIDFKGVEERELDLSRGKERSLDGRRGEEKSIDVRRVDERSDVKRVEERTLDGRPVKERARGEERCLDGGRHVFNGPLQVTLPPEPTPKSPRLQRQKPDTSSIRQRPQPTNKLPLTEGASPPPLPPKKAGELTGGRPPPRPPLDDDTNEGPPLPPPSRKKEPMADRSMKPSLSAAANSSEDEYLSPAPPPLPTGRRFDITLTHLLTCSMEDLEQRLQVPASTLSSMTLPQLTSYLRSYLAADTDRTHIHVDPTIPVAQPMKHFEEPPIPASPPVSLSGISTKTLPLPSKHKLHTKSDQFEDDFAPTKETNGTFVANFEDFDKKVNSSYDRYAAFREIQEQELKTTSLNNYNETKQNGNHKDDSDKEESLTEIKDQVERQENRSPLKSLDELTLDSFNMFRKTASPKPSQIDSKIEDVKNVMKNLQIEQSRRSVSPRETVTFSDLKREDRNDRYAALREITITEPQDEFESIPSENQPKERKRSDEKSDGFDNSDFFDCIDNNSSLSYSHVEDAFRKSPSMKEKEIKMVVTPQKEPVVRLQPQPPPRMSTESFSDMASASSPEIKVTGREDWSISGSRGRGGRGSPLSSDTSHSSRRRTTTKQRRRQTSSSSRSVSPWEEPPPAPRPHRTHAHHSRHNSSAGSRECIDSANSRDKDKLRDKRDRDRDSRGSRDSSTRERDRRSSSKERDHRRDRKRGERDRNRDADKWDRDRNRDYSRDKDTKSSREYRSRERGKDHRDKERERDRHRSSQRSWDDDDEYSDGCGSGRSSPRERWSEHSRWRRDDHNYGSLGYRDSRRRNDSRQSEEGSDRRYGSTLSWGSGRRSQSSRKEPERRRSKREESSRHRSHEARFSTDFSPRERKNSSPFENEFVDTPPAPPVVNKKRQPYSSLEGTRFAFEEDTTASPLSASSGRAPPPASSPSTRFRFDSDSVSPKSMFEDDFCIPTTTTPRIRTASIAEEEENDLPPLRTKPQPKETTCITGTGTTGITGHKDIKKSESVNIFVRENDPFENDDFFACTGSDKAARRENWPGDFQAFQENV